MRLTSPFLPAVAALAALLGVACGDDGSHDGGDAGTDTFADAQPDAHSEDDDLDGIPNALEDLNNNGEYDPDTNETNFRNRDTDGDGLDDGEEDANRNGLVDAGETDPRRADTDGDGIDDGDEPEHGTSPLEADSDHDGIDDGDEIHVTGTDPLDADSDDDGILDGEEDRNANGIVDLDETSPNDPDTDDDGTPDGAESIPRACSATTAPGTTAFADRTGDWTLILPGVYEETGIYAVGSDDDHLLRGGWFSAPDAALYGFVVSKAPETNLRTAVHQAETEIGRLGLRNGVRMRERSTAALWNWDGTAGAIGTLEWATTTEMTASQARDVVAAVVLGVDAGPPNGAPAASGPSGTTWRTSFHVSRRSDRRTVIYGVVYEAEADDTDTLLRLITDASDGTAASQFDDVTSPHCGPQPIEEIVVPVDYLWVVDASESMLDDRATVIGASSTFFDTLDRGFIDFRIGVVSTHMRTNEWYLVEPGFSAEREDFEAQMLNPPKQGTGVTPAFEFGIETATNVITLAESSFAELHTGWRPTAKRIVIFLTDEDDQTVESLGATDPACDRDADPTLANCAFVTEFVEFLEDESVTAFAITGDSPDGCTSATGPGEAEEPGAAYIRAAYESGGTFASICANDLGAAVDGIIRSSFGAVPQYELFRVPIASTMRVVKNGVLLSRSRVDGWDYDAVHNRLVFHGGARPDVGDELGVGYRVFIDESEDPTGWINPG